jgi:hypothetical protein
LFHLEPGKGHYSGTYSPDREVIFPPVKDINIGRFRHPEMDIRTVEDVVNHGLLFMVIGSYSWLFMVIHGYSWLFMVIHGYSWLFVVIVVIVVIVVSMVIHCYFLFSKFVIRN